MVSLPQPPTAWQHSRQGAVGKDDSALHEPKDAAGILPADVPEVSIAGKMTATP